MSGMKGAMFALAAFGVFAVHDVVVKFLGGAYSPFQIIFFSVLLSFPLVTLMLACLAWWVNASGLDLGSVGY